ncbi:MAG: hypothetical protein NT102_05220, partial [Caldiserica bacterium]|nr:hypothetical protein [Caldisericota bacterium]
MFLGNLLGRYLSARSGRTVSRKLYFFITIPIMIVFVVIVFAMGRSLSPVGQYVLFAVYISLASQSSAGLSRLRRCRHAPADRPETRSPAGNCRT